MSFWFRFRQHCILDGCLHPLCMWAKEYFFIHNFISSNSFRSIFRTSSCMLFCVSCNFVVLSVVLTLGDEVSRPHIRWTWTTEEGLRLRVVSTSAQIARVCLTTKTKNMTTTILSDPPPCSCWYSNRIKLFCSWFIVCFDPRAMTLTAAKIIPMNSKKRCSVIMMLTILFCNFQLQPVQEILIEKNKWSEKRIRRDHSTFYSCCSEVRRAGSESCG